MYTGDIQTNENHQQYLNRKLDRRHVSRYLALCYLYTTITFFNYEDERDKHYYSVFEPQTILEIIEEKKYHKKLYFQLIESTTQNIDKIQSIVQSYLNKKNILDVTISNKCILYLGVSEAFIIKINPTKVIINEYVELAKEIGGQNSSKFINGVLGGIIESEYK